MRKLVRLNSASAFLAFDRQSIVVANNWRLIEYSVDGARVLKGGGTRHRAHAKPSQTGIIDVLKEGGAR